MSAPVWQRMGKTWKGAERLLAEDPWFIGGAFASGMRVTIHKTLDLFLASKEWRGSTVTEENDSEVEVTHPSGAIARIQKGRFENYPRTAKQREEHERAVRAVRVSHLHGRAP